MKYIFMLIAFICTTTCIYAGNSAQLSGIIFDKKTGKTLPGVSIYFPDLKIGTTSKTEGSYSIENLPSKNIIVQISYLGFQTIIVQIDLSKETKKDFYLESSVKEINEMVITGMSKATERNRTPSSIATISNTILLQNSSTNIIDAISTQAGISQISTGAGISKPIIRGLGYNRVVVVNDGIRQEGQQWGDEHGIELDENTVNNVEILKGPASLSYGSDAMAGVVNLISAPTLGNGKIKGVLTTNYQTNNGLISISGNIAGNVKGKIWNIRYSQKMAHNYHNKIDGYVFNSGLQERSISTLMGIHKSWGYSHLTLSSYYLKPGIVEGTRDSATGKFTKEIVENDSTTSTIFANNHDFKNYQPTVAYQQIQHYKVVLNNNFYIKDGSLKLVLGLQQNRRQEYDDIFNPYQYGLFMQMNTFNYDFRYVLSEKRDWNISFGLNGMYQKSKNKGIEFLIPNYNLLDIGGFFIAKKTIKNLDFSGGLRYDIRQQHGEQLWLDENEQPTQINNAQTIHKFESFNAIFKGYSGSIGFAYQLSKKAYMKLNFSRGFRAPNIGELAANGVHDGTIRYEIGDAKLKPENSWEIDYSMGFHTEHISLELDVFNNHIYEFIYLRALNSIQGSDSISGGFKTYQFTQANANLMGVEFMFEIHPHPWDWLHLQNTFSFVNAQQINQPDSAKYLPLTPAPKLRTEVKFEHAKFHSFKNIYFKIDMENYFAQNRFYSAYETETATPHYTLFNIGMGTSIEQKKHTYCLLFISLNNATNIAYQSHLSRLKYTDYNYNTSRQGVFNMGRNVSIKLIVPIDFKK
jgi:iron complex outermembrane receptor protein